MKVNGLICRNGQVSVYAYVVFAIHVRSPHVFKMLIDLISPCHVTWSAC